MKNLIRIFFASFSISILIVMTAFGLLWVAETSKSQNGEDMSLVLSRETPYEISLSFMGGELEISLSKSEDIAKAIKNWGILAVPRGLRLVLQWNESVKSAITGESPSLPEPEYRNAWLV